MIPSYENGGYNMLDIESRIETLKPSFTNIFRQT